MQREYTELDLGDIEVVDDRSQWATKTLPAADIEFLDPDAAGLTEDELVPTRDDNLVLRDLGSDDFEDEVTRVWIRPYAARLRAVG